MQFKRKTWMRISAFLSVALILLGGITIAFVDDIYRALINKYMVLSPQSVRYEPWRKSMYPITFRIYLFNWTNPEEFRTGGKPRLVEMGPYTYSLHDKKVDLQWHENHTVTYRQSKVWYFNPEQSNGTLDDLVTTVDVVSLTAASIAERKSFLFKRFVSSAMALLDTKEYSTHTVEELLFAGYEDSLLQALSQFSIFTSQSSDDEKFPHTSFGFFDKVNDSAEAEGVFNMATGADDISQAGLIKQWNHSNRTRFFPGDCGLVRGTAGELWPPWISSADTISLFSKGLCSSLSLEFEEEAEVSGVTGYRFVPSASNFDNGSAWPGRRCNCGDRCMPSGVLSIAACKYGSPMYISFPHFYGADPHYVHQLHGVHPDPAKHKFSITVEPDTGVPLEVLGRTQFSLMLEDKPNNRVFQGMPSVLLPAMWVDVEWRLSAEKAAELPVGLPRAMNLGCLCLLVLGVIAGVCSLLLARRPHATDSPKDVHCTDEKEKENSSVHVPLEVNKNL